MRITILGKRWLLQFVKRLDKARGECDNPTEPKKEIRIREGLKGEQKLEVLIHEMLHAAAWHVDEKFVKRFAEDVARNLTKLGYTDGQID
jgi:hypothetical protein